jgi:hypothetical protein
VTASDIQRLFGTLPGLFLIVKADADFTIVGASDAYLKETFTDTGIFGRKLFEVFPANPDDIHAISVKNTTASFKRVMATGQAHVMEPLRYDVRRPGQDAYEERYWTATSSPVFDAQGGIEYLVQTAEPATAKAGVMPSPSSKASPKVFTRWTGSGALTM